MIHIIYTETQVLLSKQRWLSSREMQDAIDGYKASLGPWPVDEVVAYLNDEYPDLRPAAQQQVDAFAAGTAETTSLKFGAPMQPGRP